MNFSFKPSVSPNIISAESITQVMQLVPRKICFSSCHKDAFKKNTGGYPGKISFPFKETIKRIFEQETEIILFHNLGNYWHSIKPGEEKDLDKIDAFIEKYRDIVFLRDCLDLSIALSENLSEKNELTLIGDLEDRAKYKNDNKAVEELADLTANFIKNTPFYDSVDCVCAVPPSDPEKDNLPRSVLCKMPPFVEKDISKYVNWDQKKPPLKELDLKNKISTLNSVNLNIKTDVKNKSIIVIDDLYQSGTTLQYIGMKFKDAGASYVYGLSFVKARNNKDYV